MTCPSCSAVVESAASVCPRCGGPTVLAGEVTRLAASDADSATSDGAAGPRRSSKLSSSGGARATPSSTSGWLSSGAIDHGRFDPGALLGGRYRIVGRLGRGGMGEVYRADDLKLGQPVALKFLPADVDRDPARLTQLHTEVRMARQVSHPNVCRVYDIDEVDGHTFLSMEYVDGEDLASLLRRIGRFPEDRGLEIARQVCAGLAAAHERGVVHRDFKPANVMLDGTGKVRITDFGLAGVAGEAIRAGTPAYMAPEQIAGGEVTARSDIYALGLVLYEIFTGQRALEGKTLAELIRMREQAGIRPPASIVRDLSPEIDRAIMRCLRPDAADRPGSALAVAAALPGGDPLAAALAAGETPSPEMVAAAGDAAGLSATAGALLFLFVVAGLAAAALLSDRTLVAARLPIDKTADALEDRARDILSRLGYPDAGGDHARGVNPNGDFLDYVRRSAPGAPPWSELSTGAFSTIRFWYRTSPNEIVPIAPQWTPAPADPPVTVPGMTTTVVDERGRLIEFVAIPPPVRPAAPATPTDWGRLFEAAGLRLSDFQAVDPQRTPRAFADETAAWDGPLRDGTNVRVRVEAAAFGGRPVFFTLTGPWTRAPRVEAPPPPAWTARVLSAVGGLLGLTVVILALALARANVRSGRSDWRGATRVFTAVLLIWIAAWGTGARHYLSLSTESDRFFIFMAVAILNSGRIFVLYLALEPYVRRFCPDILISWTRLLAGGIRDERVGRDLLIGIAVGVFLGLVLQLSTAIPAILYGNTQLVRLTSFQFMLGPHMVLSNLLQILPNALGNAMTATFVFVMLRALVRRAWLAAALALALFTAVVMAEVTGDHFVVRAGFAMLFVVPVLVALLRFGVLAQISALLVNQALATVAFSLNLGRPYAPSGLLLIVAILGLSAFAFRTSRAQERLFAGVMA